MRFISGSNLPPEDIFEMIAHKKRNILWKGPFLKGNKKSFTYLRIPGIFSSLVIITMTVLRALVFNSFQPILAYSLAYWAKHHPIRAWWWVLAWLLCHRHGTASKNGFSCSILRLPPCRTPKIVGYVRRGCRYDTFIYATRCGVMLESLLGVMSKKLSSLDVSTSWHLVRLDIEGS